MKSIVETLLEPGDEASGTARSLTAVELGDIMTKMDRDNNGDVDFEEFYYWYEAEMEKKQVKLDLQLKMTLFEKDASARAEAMAESKIFEVKQKAEVRRTERSTQRSCLWLSGLPCQCLRHSMSVSEQPSCCGCFCSGGCGGDEAEGGGCAVWPQRDGT